MNAKFLPCAWRAFAVFITPCLTDFPHYLPVNTVFVLKLKIINDKEHHSHQNLAIIDSKSDKEDTNLLWKEEQYWSLQKKVFSFFAVVVWTNPKAKFLAEKVKPVNSWSMFSRRKMMVHLWTFWIKCRLWYVKPFFFNDWKISAFQ